MEKNNLWCNWTSTAVVIRGFNVSMLVCTAVSMQHWGLAGQVCRLFVSLTDFPVVLLATLRTVRLPGGNCSRNRKLAVTHFAFAKHCCNLDMFDFVDLEKTANSEKQSSRCSTKRLYFLARTPITHDICTNISWSAVFALTQKLSKIAREHTSISLFVESNIISDFSVDVIWIAGQNSAKAWPSRSCAFRFALFSLVWLWNLYFPLLRN